MLTLSYLTPGYRRIAASEPGGLRLHTAVSANSSHRDCGDTQPRKSLYTLTPKEITAVSALKSHHKLL